MLIFMDWGVPGWKRVAWQLFFYAYS
ncbi:MAG: tRNA lysidine(34) synthetase TilS [Bacteroidales bacterium]|nr:tRNA lysidine(34) synthetase TilS [Bacteroidales bacterium]